MPFNNIMKVTSIFDKLLNFGQPTSVEEMLASCTMDAKTIANIDTEVNHRPAMWQHVVCTP